MVFAAWRVSALVLVTTLACRSKDGDMEDSSFVAPDPPDDGLLVLNVRVMDFDSGPAADALRVNFRLDQIQVEHRRLIEGELQPAEWFTVASGPAPLVIYQPEWDYPQFAGEFWLPPGEIQQVKIDLGNGKITDDSGTSALTFGDVPPGAASGTLTLTPQGPNLPNILPLAPTGLEIALPAGPGGVLYPEPTGYRLATTHPAHEVPNPERFPYAWDRLVVRYDSNADPVAVQAFEQSVGAERAYSNSTFDVHILEFEGTEWWGTVVNLMTFRRSPLVTFATLDPVLRPALHDTGLLNDPGYEDWQAGFLDDIDVETAWSTSTGSRDVIVGMVDQGFDINHPDLVNNLWVNESELPTVCGSTFVSVFDLDGDGVFTLNDLNNPSSSSALSSAISDLSTCEGISLVDTTVDEAPSEDDDLYQGGDLFAALADGVDNDGNGVVDDIFGANITALSGKSCGGDEWDVDPDENCPGSDCSVHGTQMAGLIGAEHDNSLQSAGIAAEVRIAMARIDNDCGHAIFKNGGLSEYYDAVEYLYAIGADIIVVEFGSSYTTWSDYRESSASKLTADYETFPDVLFVLPAGNQGADCDDANNFCWPAHNSASNTLRVTATGIDTTVETAEMTGDYVYSSTTGTNFGLTTMNLAAPGFIYTTSGDFYPGMPTIGPGSINNDYRNWEADEWTVTGGTSASIAVTAGVAALVMAECPTYTADEVAEAILDGADTSPPTTPTVEDGRYLSATGALNECSP